MSEATPNFAGKRPKERWPPGPCLLITTLLGVVGWFGIIKAMLGLGAFFGWI